MAARVGLNCPDNPLRGSLCPLFIDRLRNVIGFLRDASNISELTRRLRGAGKHMAASMVARLSLVSIADWRWCTLETAMESLSETFLTVITNL